MHSWCNRRVIRTTRNPGFSVGVALVEACAYYGPLKGPSQRLRVHKPEWHISMYIYSQVRPWPYCYPGLPSSVDIQCWYPVLLSSFAIQCCHSMLSSSVAIQCCQPVQPSNELSFSAAIQCCHPVLPSSVVIQCCAIQCCHSVLPSNVVIQCCHSMLLSSATIQCSHSVLPSVTMYFLVLRHN